MVFAGPDERVLWLGAEVHWAVSKWFGSCVSCDEAAWSNAVGYACEASNVHTGL